MRESVYPNFLYIGGYKSGSSWIYETLREHPQVFVPPAKDLQFFDVYYDKGINWYFSFFKPKKGEIAIGELSHNYFFSEEYAKRIYALLPKVKLFCCLREPVDKIMSAYLHRKHTGEIGEHTDFENFAFDQNILKENDYYNNLLPFYQRFPKENISVLFFDELKENPIKFCKNIYSFLGVDENFIPSVLYKRVLSAQEARVGLISRFAFSIGRLMRSMGLANFVGQVKRNKFFEIVFYRKIEKKRDIPYSTRIRLENHFQKDYGKLSGLIGKDIPTGWYNENI